MEQFRFDRIGETLYRELLPNGLTVYVFPKPEFGKSYAFFATNYGAIDTRFVQDGVPVETPAGVAHFLEHKMFDTEEGNALQSLSANGASPNAFTSTSITGYYFESTQRFEDNLSILLSFVSVPWFTQESVDKEQGIIGQEIRMIEDDPNWQVYTNLMAALYVNHPVRVSVAGSRESISHITAQTLYDCHRAFYDPANMVLCAAGPVDPERVVALAREILPRAGRPLALRDYGDPEPVAVASEECEVAMEVSTPIFRVGFKADPPPQGEGRLRQRLLGELACDVLMSTSTPLYGRLYAEGLINSGFSWGYEDDPGCAFLSAGGESRDPRAVRDAIRAEAERIGREGVDEALWQRLKKAAYGNRIRTLNSFEQLCIEQAAGHFAGLEYLEFAAMYETLEKADAEDCLRRWTTAERTALSLVVPKEGGT